ncbi:uncharacterized protein M6B38_360880 [Iris pallida]|uniref:Lysine ketoglutarate reductase trans-splicing-like protein n=1 Tax=Iris pallida TaxID=29817 RepID=A0AAX6GKC2_IRIPA|nr:uncharacterized protein M6B38_360880 [Iris pallida]
MYHMMVVSFPSLPKGPFGVREYWCKVKLQTYTIFLCMIMLFIVYRMTNLHHRQTEMEMDSHSFETVTDRHSTSVNVGYLPRGIVHSNSDMELKPLWVKKSSEVEEGDKNRRNLIAITVGIKQKTSVDAIVKKFLQENFTVLLFHYDGNVNGWHDLQWSGNVIHIAANDQTKWWFAKRFLHPDVVSAYDYIFLWDEDLGVDNFDPGRYLRIMKSAGLEISQPALDPKLSEIHHQITARRKKGKVHRRVYDARGNRKCTRASEGPPCSGWVEGMAPVFSRSAWRCAWNLIQNDLIHGWGMDMKLGYCAQGDRTEKVGVIDSEFIVHQGIQTLGESSKTKSQRSEGLDSRTER